MNAVELARIANARRAAFSRPPQQGTSMRATVRERTSFSQSTRASFSA